MIRSRKDEGTASAVAVASPLIVVLNKHDNVSGSTLGITDTNVATTATPAAFRYQQQRTLSNTGTSKTATIATTPTMKRTSSSIAAIGMNKDDNKSSANSAPSATAVSSFANTTSSSVSSSLQYYHNLLQHQMYNVRKGRNKKKSKHQSDANIWTVQMPKRMLFGTMGIFLLIPVLIFVYKEMHLQSIDEKELRGSRSNEPTSDGTIVVKKANRNQEYASWIANILGTDEDDEGDEVLDSAASDANRGINETISKEIYGSSSNNETTGSSNDDKKMDDEQIGNGINEDPDNVEEGTDELQ
jgi:hypothetical protein